MSESSNQHADVSWPHPASEAARHDRYAPDRPARRTLHTDEPAGPRD